MSAQARNVATQINLRGTLVIKWGTPQCRPGLKKAGPIINGLYLQISRRLTSISQAIAPHRLKSAWAGLPVAAGAPARVAAAERVSRALPLVAAAEPEGAAGQWAAALRAADSHPKTRTRQPGSHSPSRQSHCCRNPFRLWILQNPLRRPPLRRE